MSVIPAETIEQLALEQGDLSVLNVGAGDLRFSFDSQDPAEVERAQRVIEDMLKRGYNVFVEWGSGLRRVKKFMASRNTYVIEEPNADQPQKKREVEVPAKQTRAYGVAPTAGG